MQLARFNRLRSIEISADLAPGYTMGDAVDWFAEQGLELKGLAPVIADFPSLLDGEPDLREFTLTPPMP